MIGAVQRLANPVRHYAWGSPTAIPEFLRSEADGSPVAELWMGAHPLDSSRLVGDDGTEPLDAAVEAAPEQLLGAAVTERWGPRLPFLLKVIAAAEPLSLQVHPNAEQAEAGFAREEASGLPRTAPQRSYRDPSHKPEVALALTPFRALAGFRPPVETLAVIDGLELDGSGAAAPSPTLAAFRAALRLPDPSQALREAFDVVTGAGLAEVAGACEALAEASAARLAGGGAHEDDDRCVVDLQRAHPADIGVLLSVLMHHVVLAPGEALFVGPGQPHAYLCGLAVEAMACSDNVLRAGLTRKHVDIAELRSVLDFTPVPLPRLEPRRRGTGLVSFEPPVDDVALDVVDVGRDDAPSGGPLPAEPGPRILLALAGELRVGADGAAAAGAAAVELSRGQSVFVPAGTQVQVHGRGRLAVARVGRG